MKKLTRSFTAERADDGLVVLSTETPCPQDGLILASGGWDLSRFAKVPPKMFYNHATSWGDEFPIGRWEDVQVKDRKLCGRPVFAAEEHPERAGVVAKLWDGGFLDDVSVSFKVNAQALSGPVKHDGRDYMVSTSHELLECSIVGIGADPNAGKGRLSLASPESVLTRAVIAGVVTQEEALSLCPERTLSFVRDEDSFDPEVSPDAEPMPTSADITRHKILIAELEVNHANLATQVETLTKGLETLTAAYDRLREEITRAAKPAAPAPDPAPQRTDPEPGTMTLDPRVLRESIRAAQAEQVKRAVAVALCRATGRLVD